MTPQEQLDRFKRSLQDAVEEKARLRQEKDRSAVFQQIGQYLNAALSPLREAVKQMIGAANDMKRVASQVERIGEIQIPEPRINVDLSSFPAPNVTVKPVIDMPKVEFPKEMDMKGFVTLMGYDRGLLENPLPVQLRDAKGNPVKLFENLTTLVQGGGGGGFQNVRVSNLDEISISATVSTSVSLVNSDGNYYNSDNPLPITGSITSTPGATYYASDAIGSVNLVQIGGEAVTQGPGEEVKALRVVHASDALTSVNLNQIGGNLVTQGPGEGLMGLRVVHASDAIASVNIVGNIASLDTIQVSGSVSSVNLNQIAGNPTVVGTGYQDNALRVVEATDSITSVNLNQVNGSAVVVGTGYQDNALRVVIATDAVSSVNLNQTAGNPTVVGTGYQDNALRVVHATDAIVSVSVTGSTGTTAIVGDISPGSANVNSPPVRVGGVATQTNPTAIADGNIVNFRADDLGRQITRPVQVRDLIATAYVSVTNGTETTLKAAVAGAYLDCIMLVGSNNSDAAVSVDIRAVTAGNIVHTLRIPANGTAGWAPQVPWPQDETGNNWTVDGPDETGRTLTFSALFSKET